MIKNLHVGFIAAMTGAGFGVGLGSYPPEVAVGVAVVNLLIAIAMVVLFEGGKWTHSCMRGGLRG